MKLNPLVGLSALALAALGASGCYGKLDPHGGPEVVGSYAELVAQKKEWLEGYDEDCQICFQAFEQCQAGAEDSAQRDACQTALESCVRGGLVSPDDASDDSDDGSGDDDPDSDDEGDVSDDGGGFSDDAGASDDDVDAGVGDGDFGDETDADAGLDDSDDDVIIDDSDDATSSDSDSDENVDDEGSDDADENSNAGEVADVKQELISNIEACLEDARSCVSDDDADVRACVVALDGCVKAAISEAFGDFCSGQIGLCIAERAPEDALESVEDICQLGLD